MFSATENTAGFDPTNMVPLAHQQESAQKQLLCLPPLASCTLPRTPLPQEAPLSPTTPLHQEAPLSPPTPLPQEAPRSPPTPLPLFRLLCFISLRFGFKIEENLSRYRGMYAGNCR
jgi:hypothetical protein